MHTRRFCIDQSDPNKTQAGIAGFKRFLGKSKNMVAFVSGTYFSRVRCLLSGDLGAASLNII